MSDFAKNPDWGQILGAGFVLGMFFMGVVMTNIGNPSKDEVRKAKAQCELNIPRNQNCIMQFVPEGKK